jgi:hypothetical protein
MSVSLTENNSGSVFISETYTQFETSVQGATAVAETYNVVYASSTTYKVEISEAQGQSILNATTWVLKNGTAVAYNYLGQNITGPEASGLYQGLMTPFFIESEYGVLVQTFASASGVQATSQGTAQIGSTTLALTNYSADTVPLTIPICGGSVTLSSASLEVGGIQGVNASLLTALRVSGSETYHGQTDQIVLLSFRLIAFRDA